MYILTTTFTQTEPHFVGSEFWLGYTANLYAKRTPNRGDTIFTKVVDLNPMLQRAPNVHFSNQISIKDLRMCHCGGKTHSPYTAGCIASVCALISSGTENSLNDPHSLSKVDRENRVS